MARSRGISGQVVGDERADRISTVVDQDLADWLRRRSAEEGRSVSVLVREVLSRFRDEDEERYWAREGEERLATFDRKGAVPHEDAWD